MYSVVGTVRNNFLVKEFTFILHNILKPHFEAFPRVQIKNFFRKESDKFCHSPSTHFFIQIWNMISIAIFLKKILKHVNMHRVCKICQGVLTRRSTKSWNLRNRIVSPTESGLQRSSCIEVLMSVIIDNVILLHEWLILHWVRDCLQRMSDICKRQLVTHIKVNSAVKRNTWENWKALWLIAVLSLCFFIIITRRTLSDSNK